MNMNDNRAIPDFTYRLAEIIHYALLYATLPSIHQDVSAATLRTEALALSLGYVEQTGATFTATALGRLWLVEWAEGATA